MWTVIVRDAAGGIHSKTQLKTGVVTLGRSNDCDIVLASASVSRLHGRLLVGGGTTLIYSDERSANGSFVDGQPVTTAVDVGVDNLIKVGEFTIGFECEGQQSKLVSAAMNATVIFRPHELELIAQGPSKPPPSPAAASKPPPPSFSSTQAQAQTVTGTAAGLKSALPGFEFKNLDALAPAKPFEAPPPASLSESITGLLDQQIRGIQSHRSNQQQSERSRSEQFDQQWRDAVVAARELQGKLRGNARVMYFVISRDEGEVSIKLSDSSKRGYTNLILSKRHPENGKLAEGVCWFGVFGEDAQPYREPKLALEDFVRRVAGKLA